MSDEWDDGPSSTSVEAPFDRGTDFGRGRGFVAYEENDFDSPGLDENGDSGFGGRGHGNGRGRGRGRGRGSGRGGRGGGGRRFDNDDNEDRDSDSYSSRGGGRSRGRGGREDNRGREDNKTEPERPRENYIPPPPTEDEDEIFGQGISSGINFDKYDNIKVEVTGENKPGPIVDFARCGLREFVLQNVKKCGYKKPTPVQKYAIPIIAGGRDLMACAQTGSGKTAAFLLPIINTILNDPRELVMTGQGCEPHAVILSPTRELALQIFNEARKFALGSIVKSVVVYGGTSTMHQAQQVARGCHILVATPGRLMDFLNRGRVNFQSVRFVVLDEADRMLDMGFLPDVEKMLEHPTMVPTGERQTVMVSATFPEEIQRLATKFLSNYLFLAVGIVGGACSDVEQIFYKVSKFDKRAKLQEILREEGGKKVLVFVETKRIADFLAAFLCEAEFPTTSIHGDRLQSQREEALYDFKSGRMGILVATAVAARGLDIKNVAHVINYDLPKSIDEYVHRIGRTGRVGNRGRATSFYDPDVDAPLARDLVKILQQANQNVPSFLESDAKGGVSAYKGGQFGGSDFRNFEEPENLAGLPEPEEAW
ncbi:ATP-dependent RNA helicase vasa isoform X6 [Schistocerca cancellata]|uniref:ATP-dependent RNA helicase vasa isoform X1 n=1 Tax=Schistocerca cancellata TaxID=274614 RepID=UPI002119383B|nr:ATP-dependent RNA helicase vasa isoform X1 [Schistocerca cancellata]XP_049786611.1 ATP-dependent RNA helicase vasa isoform X2 [Schistocerca cancellata]XP_049786612.1 ATP-dependent RNA helicase vasa isoform X3 [Schistocerca cancellata]XP_049786613.1 ATP-dependent RNA helicase vasa isoform X4 [Schistocerca cancellata]XP_049786614.1 ATP-dependent RNA helicase vasa isoform X4 [Schistocerca cancellata]XP_049786616.1 ATP-dependent RNA helicase vasa isoform X2 [Schistocerca cancellata]XP_04978661